MHGDVNARDDNDDDKVQNHIPRECVVDKVAIGRVIVGCERGWRVH